MLRKAKETHEQAALRIGPHALRRRDDGEFVYTQTLRPGWMSVEVSPGDVVEFRDGAFWCCHDDATEAGASPGNLYMVSASGALNPLVAA